MRSFGASLFVFFLCAVNTPLLAACLNGGTDATIQAALGTAPGAEAVLCPASFFSIYNTIRFTANGQKIYTEGFPDLTQHAVLEVKSSSVATVILGLDRSSVQVRNIMIDGGSDVYGQISGGPPLLSFGGDATNQLIDAIVAFNPRGWSTIHTYEGNYSGSVGAWSGGCTNATITNNWIANAGVVNAQGQWADGISHACRNSRIANNLIQNATDGAIVVFAAPGSIIEYNTIEVTTEALGGINMVDIVYEGDYSGTIVRNNTIRSENLVGSGTFLHTGIAIGPRTWFSNCPTSAVKNGTVTGNHFDGPGFGYAIVVDGATNFTVTGNTLDASFAAYGNPVLDCGGYAAAPGAFKKHGIHVTGTYQSDFIEGSLHRAAAITP